MCGAVISSMPSLSSVDKRYLYFARNSFQVSLYYYLIVSLAYEHQHCQT
jgi:hypothetical protein